MCVYIYYVCVDLGAAVAAELNAADIYIYIMCAWTWERGSEVPQIHTLRNRASTTGFSEEDRGLVTEV